MRWGGLSDVTSQALMSALRGTAARQVTVAHNLANVDTPGFSRVSVDFEAALASALDEAKRLGGDPEPIRHCLPCQRTDLRAPRRADGNNVDIEREVTEMVRNGIAHQAALELLAQRIRLLRAIIRGHRAG